MNGKAVVRLVPSDDRRTWAEAEFEAVADALTNADRDVKAARNHMRLLVENWTDGYNISEEYPQYRSVGAVFEAKFPDVYQRTYLKEIAQRHRMRLLLGGLTRQTPSDEEITDRSLRALGDPAYWADHLDELAEVWSKARAIADQRRKTWKGQGIAPSRGVIGGDLREAMGRARNARSGSIEYWHNVLHKLTTYDSGLDATMAIRVATTAVWAVNRYEGKPDPKEVKALRDEMGRLGG